jgi:hypothetical protein
MSVNNSNVSHKVGAAAINISEILTRLNAEEAIRRLPVVIFILILMIIGVFGNLHVLYIYYRKFNVSTYRISVLSLATIDIISCCVSMPFEIADELNPYIFKAEIACKIFRFLNTCLAMATALMLVVIASERYRRICKPYGNQMTEKQSRYWLIGVVCFAICASLPALYVYGRKTIDIPGETIKGSECTWSDSVEGKAIGYIYYAWGLLVIIVCMVLLVILYSLVGVHLRTHTIKVQSTIRIKKHRNRSTRRRSRSILGSRRKSRNVRSADSKALNDRKTNVTDRASTQSNPLDGRPTQYEIIDDGTKQRNFIAEESIESKFRRSSNEASVNKAIITAILSVDKKELNNHLTISPGNINFHNEAKNCKSHNNHNSIPVTENRTRNMFASKIQLKELSTENGQKREANEPALNPLCGKEISCTDKNVIIDPNTVPEIKTISRRGGTIMRKTKTFISDREQRITKVLFTITLLFIFSFLPYIIILIVYSADATYEEKLSPTAYVVYLMGLRLYLINNVANSLLYISFDLKFRKYFLNIYNKI